VGLSAAQALAFRNSATAPGLLTGALGRCNAPGRCSTLAGAFWRPGFFGQAGARRRSIEAPFGSCSTPLS